ncbi:hypothetical protein, partial [Persicitalea sp.]|uniref:hypothetical protein n=1 Tax=Persicitalea sp. TaxID=3100273 RepID=UPI00359346E1
RTRIMKTPSYYADWNTRLGTEESHKDLHLLKFKNFGISRFSLMLGVRNPLNTAVTPARFGNDNPTLVSAYDVGRPYILDPVSLELQTPIGDSSEWMTGTPAKVPWAFELFETTAHPCFDPHTKELFSVNYSRVEQSVIMAGRTVHHLKNNHEHFKQKLVELMERHQDNPDHNSVRERLTHFFENLDEELYPPSKPGFFARIRQAVESFFQNIFHKKNKKDEASGAAVTLMRFDGTGPWKKWVLHDQHGEQLQIKNCMHQTGLTRDYIILQDSSFKFSNELLINNPFPEHLGLERFIRKVLATTMLPYTECYLVRRQDLKEDANRAIAYKLDKPIPIETIHFSCDYENPGGQITLYGIHNAAMCVAEWIRPYDLSALTGKAIDPEVLSLFSLGTMDVSRLGKWKIDAKNNRLQEDKSIVLCETGDTEAPAGEPMGFNTWTISLYTFRDIIASDTVANKIEHLWFVSSGLDSRMLTVFIEQLYRDYPNRQIPYEKVKELTRKGLPYSLNYLNTETMTTNDSGYYQFMDGDYLRSVQFVPRKTPTPGVPYGLDGYIYCSIQVAYPQADGSCRRQGEFWIFRAEAISAGPICKMYHPEVNFCFTLHSAWLPNPQPNSMKHKIDVRKDYGKVIDNLPDKVLIEDFFEKYVYPNFS